MRTIDILNSVTHYLRRGNRITAYKSTEVKGGLSSSAGSFVIKDCLATRISICAEMPVFRQSAKRLPQFKRTDATAHYND
jgi:hypothetical protein